MADLRPFTKLHDPPMWNSGAHLYDDRSTSFETNHRRDVPVSAGFGIPENSIFLVLEKLNSQY
jgi:hypothetical protein